MWADHEHGPTAFYATRTKDRPCRPDDVVGIVGWKMGPRGGIKWVAGAGCNERGSIKVGAGQEFGSRRAAAAWVDNFDRAAAADGSDQ